VNVTKCGKRMWKAARPGDDYFSFLVGFFVASMGTSTECTLPLDHLLAFSSFKVFRHESPDRDPQLFREILQCLLRSGSIGDDFLNAYR